MTTITLIQPSTAPAGAQVTIVGTGFTGATAVKFGATNATSFAVVADSVITAVVPAGAGTVLVTVVAPSGTSNGVAFDYIGAPTGPVIAVISPTSGPAAGGTSVTIVGTGFTGATAVKFGATNATSFTVLSGNVITAVAPPGAGTVLVTVVTPSGTSNGAAYNYTA